MRTASVVLGVLVGGALGWSVRAWRSDPPVVAAARVSKVASTRHEGRIVRGDVREWVHPVLACELNHDAADARLEPVRLRLAEAVANARSAGGVDDIAVYVRDLVDGGAVGIDADHRFPPASLLKTPVLMGVLRAAVSQPNLMSKKVKMPAAWPDSEVPPEGTLEVGREYSIAELVEAMILKSDNDAKDLLISALGSDLILDVLKDFGLAQGDMDMFARIVTPRTYARVFEALYNAIYVEPDASSYALSLLARSEFTAGIVQGTPEGVRVANKFGYRIDDRADPPKRFLHDCGIVYQPQRPFVLCIMTRGDTIKRLTQVVQDIARVVYRATSERTATKPRSDWPPPPPLPPPI